MDIFIRNPLSNHNSYEYVRTYVAVTFFKFYKYEVRSIQTNIQHATAAVCCLLYEVKS